MIRSAVELLLWPMIQFDLLFLYSFLLFFIALLFWASKLAEQKFRIISNELEGWERERWRENANACKKGLYMILCRHNIFGVFIVNAVATKLKKYKLISSIDTQNSTQFILLVFLSLFLALHSKDVEMRILTYRYWMFNTMITSKQANTYSYI